MLGNKNRSPFFALKYSLFAPLFTLRDPATEKPLFCTRYKTIFDKKFLREKGVGRADLVNSE